MISLNLVLDLTQIETTEHIWAPFLLLDILDLDSDKQDGSFQVLVHQLPLPSP